MIAGLIRDWQPAIISPHGDYARNVDERHLPGDGRACRSEPLAALRQRALRLHRRALRPPARRGGLLGLRLRLAHLEPELPVRRASRRRAPRLAPPLLPLDTAWPRHS